MHNSLYLPAVRPVSARERRRFKKVHMPHVHQSQSAVLSASFLSSVSCIACSSHLCQSVGTLHGSSPDPLDFHPDFFTSQVFPCSISYRGSPTARNVRQRSPAHDRRARNRHQSWPPWKQRRMLSLWRRMSLQPGRHQDAARNMQRKPRHGHWVTKLHQTCTFRKGRRTLRTRRWVSSHLSLIHI